MKRSSRLLVSHPFNPPLKVSGAKFTDAAGANPLLMGFYPCCYFQEWCDYRADLKNQGQTPGHNKWKTPHDMIADASDAGFNLAVIRVGPWWNPFQGGLKHPIYYRAYEQVGDKADLSRFRADFWDHKKADLDYLTSLRMYVEVSLLDVWAFKNDGVIMPWNRKYNIQGFNDGGCSQLTKPPHKHAERWIRKTVRTLGYGKNVIWEIGNESFGCEGALRSTWETGVVRIIRDEEKKRGYIKHLIGSNAAPLIPDTPWASYQSYHERNTDIAKLSRQLGRPVQVNEVNPFIRWRDWSAYTQNAMKNSLHYVFWLSDSSDKNITSALKEAGRIRQAQGFAATAVGVGS
jgi:hypothetical protein